MAGVPGFEPGPTVLETAVLAVDTIPLNKRLKSSKKNSATEQFGVPTQLQWITTSLFGFFMVHVFAARIAKFLKFQTCWSFLFVLGRHVIFIFALFAN